MGWKISPLAGGLFGVDFVDFVSEYKPMSEVPRCDVGLDLNMLG